MSRDIVGWWCAVGVRAVSEDKNIYISEYRFNPVSETGEPIPLITFATIILSRYRVYVRTSCSITITYYYTVVLVVLFLIITSFFTLQY